MPWKDTIPDPEDGSFFTSIGHWTGNAVFEPGPIWGMPNTAALYIPVGDTQKTMTLQYPNIKPIPGKRHYLYIITAVAGTYEDILVTWKITDGTHEEQDSTLILGTQHWIQIQKDFLIPKDFDITLTQFTITAYDAVHTNMSGLFIHGVFLKHFQKIDYLPLVGIG